MRILLENKSLGSKFPQILAALLATFGAISDGIHYGWASPIIPLLQEEDSNIPITHTEVMWLELLYMLGGLSGLPITIYVVDKIGRKYSILAAAVTHVISFVLIGIARNIETIYVARFMCGVAGDVAFVAAPMYIAEIADRHIRGFLAGFIYVAMLIGILIVYAVAPFVSIPVSSAVGAIFVIIQITTFSFMPESPYYLLLCNKREEAHKVLQFFRGTPDVSEEMDEIEQAIARQQKEKGSPLELVEDSGNRKALIIMTVLNGSQHMSSISVMLMNLHTILNDAAGIISSKLSGIIFATIMLVSATGAISVVDKFGRKKLLLVSSLLTGLSLSILGTYFAVRNAGISVQEYNWVPIFAVFLYAIAFKVGLGIVPIVLTGELFPTNVKAMGMTISDAMYVIFATISIYIYQWLEADYGLHSAFYLFSGCCLVTAVFCWVYIPETNGKTLEEIQFILRGISPPTLAQTSEKSQATKV